MGTLVGMAATVDVDDAQGGTFRCTRTQWERLHQPAGLELVADEDGKPARKTSRKPENTDTGD